MKEFPSLREFLLLRDPFDTNNTAHRFTDIDPAKFVAYYDTCKTSWEKYGDEGPPVGSLVRALVSGCGGGDGVLRIFTGVWASGHRWFELTRKDGSRPSLVTREHWWLTFEVDSNSGLK